MDLSIIIVSWNTRDLLAQCLGSAATSLSTDHRPPTTELIVVDNGSTDGSAAMVRERFPQARLVRNPQNVGFACANNQAIRASTGRHLLLLNSDTLVQSGALANMTAFMDAHPKVGILGANILNSDGTPQRCFGQFPSLVSEAIFAWGLDNRYPFSRWLGRPRTINEAFIDADWVIGAALMVRREALDQVGLLDESYFMYSEEIDLARRVKKAGWNVGVLRDACVVHLGGQSAKQIPAEMKAQLFKSKVMYFRKHHGPAAALLVKLIFLSSIYAKQLAYGLLGQREKSSLWAESRRHFASA